MAKDVIKQMQNWERATVTYKSFASTGAVYFLEKVNHSGTYTEGGALGFPPQLKSPL